MRISEIVESLTDWGDEWIHFSKHPMLTVNPKQIHQDPAGIYFFPASINPDAELWRTMPYKFTVNIRPDAHILDVSQVTPEQVFQMIDAAESDPRDVATNNSGDPLRIKDQFQWYINQYPPKDNIKLFDMAWEQLQRHYAFGLSKARQYSSFNAMLRKLGWQAIFDDTGSVHVGEKQQLLVLDPRIITNVRVEQRSGRSGAYAAMQKVLTDAETFGRQYGTVTVDPVRKPNARDYYTEQDLLLKATVTITNPTDERNYTSVFLSIQPNYPDRISAVLRYTSPQLGYGSGTEYSISRQQYTDPGGIEKFKRDFDKIFAPQESVPQEVDTVSGGGRL